MPDLKEKFNTLSESIKKLLLDDDFGAYILNTSEKNGISDIQDLSVEDAVTHMLIGDLSPRKFTDALVKEGISPEKTFPLAQALATEVLSSVEQDLQRMYAFSGALKDAFVRPSVAVPQAPIFKTSKPASQMSRPISAAPTSPISNTLAPKPPMPPPKTPAPMMSAPKPPVPPLTPQPQTPKAFYSGEAKTYQHDIERAKSGLPPAGMMTPPAGAMQNAFKAAPMGTAASFTPPANPVKPQTPFTPTTARPPVPPQAPQNLPGAERSSIASTGKIRPSEHDPAPHTISVPQNVFEEKLQRTVGGAGREGSASHPASADPYREPLQ